MTEWYDGLDAMWDSASRRLTRGVADRKAAARHPVLATVGLDGFAEARVVVLRGFDLEGMVLEVHTDLASAKCREIEAYPGITLMIWDAKANLQIRIRALASFLDRAETEEIWPRVPETARKVYGGTPAPGHPLVAPDMFVPASDQARFAVLKCRAVEVDMLYLGADYHRRAEFKRIDGWVGRWIAP